MAAFADLKDDFNGTTLDKLKWVVESGTYEVGKGYLSLKSTPYQTAHFFSGVMNDPVSSSVPTLYDLPGSYLAVKLGYVETFGRDSDIVTGVFSAYGHIHVQITGHSVAEDGTVTNGTLYVLGDIEGQNGAIGVPYDPDAHQWIRFRQDADNMTYVDVAQEYGVWSNLWTHKSDYSLAQAVFYIDVYAGVADTVVLVDAVNVGNNSLLRMKLPQRGMTLVGTDAQPLYVRTFAGWIKIPADGRTRYVRDPNGRWSPVG